MRRKIRGGTLGLNCLVEPGKIPKGRKKKPSPCPELTGNRGFTKIMFKRPILKEVIAHSAGGKREKEVTGLVW